MNHSLCDATRLQQLLADELSEQDSVELSDHLSACTSCQEQLEQLAGESEWWQEVETGLRRRSLEQMPGGTTWGAWSPSVEIDGGFATDFAVDYLEPTDSPDELGRLGDIAILGIIGRGGMGVVLKGYQSELGRFVAVKVLAPHLAASGSARQRFEREARAAAAIVHPNVMPIYSVHAKQRLPYLVMPYVDCESLEERVQREGPLDIKQILRIALQTASGLAAAHAQGLVHRDVKPANILLEAGVDRVILTDFGLARAVDDATLTRTGIIAGTPQFMSPEQARGEVIGQRSDLFSLGSVTYAMCTGRPPFQAETSLGTLRRVTDTEPRSIRDINPDLPAWLEQVVARLHHKSPDSRFDSAEQVSAVLERCLAHVQQPTVHALPMQLREPQQHWGWKISTGIALLALITLGIWMQWGPAGKGAATRQEAGSPARTKRPVEQGEAETITEISEQDGELDWDDGVDSSIEELWRDTYRLESNLTGNE